MECRVEKSLETAYDALKVVASLYKQYCGESFLERLEMLQRPLIQTLRRLRLCLDILYLEGKPISYFYDAVGKALEKRGAYLEIEDVVREVKALCNGTSRRVTIR